VSSVLPGIGNIKWQPYCNPNASKKQVAFCFLPKPLQSGNKKFAVRLVYSRHFCCAPFRLLFISQQKAGMERSEMTGSPEICYRPESHWIFVILDKHEDHRGKPSHFIALFI